MSNQQDSKTTSWEEWRPIVLVFFAVFLSIMGILSPNIAILFPEFNILIGFTGGISLLTGIKLLFEFRKSD